MLDGITRIESLTLYTLTQPTQHHHRTAGFTHESIGFDLEVIQGLNTFSKF